MEENKKKHLLTLDNTPQEVSLEEIKREQVKADLQVYEKYFLIIGGIFFGVNFLLILLTGESINILGVCFIQLFLLLIGVILGSGIALLPLKKLSYQEKYWRSILIGSMIIEIMIFPIILLSITS